MPASKKTSGTLYVLGVGDSIAEGVGADPTGDGSDGLKYGGAPVPAWLTLIMDGTTYSTTLPDTAGAAGANPGYWIHLALAAKAAGFDNVVIVVNSTSGSEVSAINSNDFLGANGAAYQMASRGWTPDLVVVCAGTNNAQVGENTGFETASALLLSNLEASYPNARFCWMEPVSLAAGTYPESDLVRADIQTLMAAKTTRFSVAGAGQPRADDAHPSLQAYKDMGEDIFPGYLAAG